MTKDLIERRWENLLAFNPIEIWKVVFIVLFDILLSFPDLFYFFFWAYLKSWEYLPFPKWVWLQHQWSEMEIVQWKSSLARSRGSDSDHLRMECWEPLWVWSWPRESLLWATGSIPKAASLLGMVIRSYFRKPEHPEIRVLTNWTKRILNGCVLKFFVNNRWGDVSRIDKTQEEALFSGVVSGWGCWEFSSVV